MYGFVYLYFYLSFLSMSMDDFLLSDWLRIEERQVRAWASISQPEKRAKKKGGIRKRRKGMSKMKEIPGEQQEGGWGGEKKRRKYEHMLSA